MIRPTLDRVLDWLKCLMGYHAWGYATQVYVANPDGRWHKVCKRCGKETLSASS